VAPLIEKHAYAPQKCLYLRSSSEPRVAIGLVVRCKHVGEASDLVNTTAEVPKPFIRINGRFAGCGESDSCYPAVEEAGRSGYV